jgi:serine/threonine-protein kinase HipA
MAKKTLYVFADWQGLNGPLFMGTLSAEMLRGKEIFSFEYHKEWLSAQTALQLDPHLQWYAGPQYLAGEEKSNFGLFLDSSPDRWGRELMQRREAVEAKLEGRPMKRLEESDYLLGVYDGHRIGGLRFKTDLEGPYLNDNEKLASPPWTSLRELEQLSLKLESAHAEDDPDYARWLNMLVAPGSSLGGARPKASVVAPDGSLWIAKFPSLYDSDDTGAWEMVVSELASQAGIRMAQAQARKFSGTHHTFLSKRFDRTDTHQRIHFASAMTLLGQTDGADAATGISYLHLAEFLLTHGVDVNEDLQELWRRIVFNICVSNTDDHLRNHGFLLKKNGWTLSPAFDINPTETGTGLKLNISEYDNSLDLELAVEVRTYFRLSDDQASQISQEVKSAVRAWRTMASRYGISRAEQDRKARAFRLAEI